MKSRPRVVIVGGGISGLATAHYLHRHLGAQVQLMLVEGGPRLGGKVATAPFAGHLVDTGPDALLVRSSAMAALLEDLGLHDRLVAPAALGAHVLSRGVLRRLPTGTLFGVPDRLLPLLRSRLLSPLGLARAALDLVLPRRHTVLADPSIADLVCPRLGAQVFDRLVEPLLGGVHAGRAGELSARSTVPEVAALARDNRSLYLGLRKMRRNAPPASGAPILVTLDCGLVGLVEALASRLPDGAARVDNAVRRISRDGDGYLVELLDGPSLAAEAVVMATPAFVTARLLADLTPDAATVLAEIPYADVATIWLAYPRSAMGRALDGTGFLVPPEEGRLLVGCTWSSAKWPHLAAAANPADSVSADSANPAATDSANPAASKVLIRCLVGRHGDQRWLSMDDETLVHEVHQELVEVMGLTAGPAEQRIQRWPRGMPQYLVGHHDRLDAVDAALRPVAGLFLTGAGYRGVGIASCVTDAKRIAEDIAHYLTGDATQGTGHDSATAADHGDRHDSPTDATAGVSENLADDRPLTEVTS